MRKTLTLLLTLFCAVGYAQKGTVSANERKFIIDYLDRSQADLNKLFADLSDEQWFSKPESGGWSVAECVEHIVLAENAVFGQVNKALAEPSGDQDLSMNDAWLLSKITDRGRKVQTPLEPKNGKLSKAELNASLETSRKELYSFLSNKKLELRNHYGKSPYGAADAYQLLIVLSAHTTRHLAQIEEILNELNS